MDTQHGGNIYEIERTRNISREEIVDYSANINPLGPPPSAKEAMQAAFSRMSRYPDIAYGDLRRAIADYESVPPEWILLGNGAADVLFGLTRAVHPKQAAIISPAFSEYRQACQAIDCGVQEIILTEDSGFQPEESLLDRIPQQTDILFLCSPNNPTGAVCTRALVQALARQAQERKGILVVDESFLDFREDEPERTAIRLCKEYPNLVVLKSLTKFYAMAGVRIGYALCSSQLLQEEYQRISPPWMLSTFAEQLTIAALQDRDYQKTSRKSISLWATELYRGMQKLPEIRVYPPGANFLLFSCQTEIDLKEKLLNQRILIRRCAEFAGLGSNWYRVCVSDSAKNQRLLQALSNTLRHSPSHQKSIPLSGEAPGQS